jgi:hypothetical protein
MGTPFDAPDHPLAGLLRRLGGISPDRVLLDPAPGTATKDDVVRIGKPACELVEGTLVRRPDDFQAALLIASLACWVIPPVRNPNLGIVTNALAPVEVRPGTVRIPDLAYSSWSRMPGRRMSREPIPAIVPEIVADFIKPGHTPAELARKRADYFAGGLTLYWLFDADRRTAAVFMPKSEPVLLTCHDTLTGGDVLPGFTLPLADLFAELDRHG